MALRQYLVPATATILSACATEPVDPNRPIPPACDQSVDCFYERSIRSFQVLDDRTIIVIVGRDQCPYKLELDGFFCDISLSSFIAFDDPDGRICTWDRSFVAGGPFTRESEYCRVSQVTPMTDDELLEAYATKGLMPPLPAKGSGEIEVEEEPDAEPSPDVPSTGATETPESSESSEQSRDPESPTEPREP